MPLRRILGGALLCVVLFGSAVAEVKVCNDYHETVWVAIGWVENHDTRTEGWWRVNTRSCVVVDDRPLQRPHYVYAETNWRDLPGGTRIRQFWGDKVQLVVGAEDSFKYQHAQTISLNDRTVLFKDLAAGVERH